MAAVTNSTSTSNPDSGPQGRQQRPLNNEDLQIYYLTAIDSTDTFTPYPTTTGVFRSIYDWALKPVAAVDAWPAVNVGNGAEMKAVYTPPTSSAAGFFTFTCTAGTGKAYLYVWAK